MKILENENAPNPRRLRIFLAEKGLDIPREQVDLRGMEQKGEAFTAINPTQTVPVLILDDGTTISESVAICRYFEELYPDPPLFGTDPLSKALIEMWNRRIELNLFGAVRAAFRHLHPSMKEREIPQIPEWGEANKPKAIDFLTMLDREIEGRDYIAGDAFSIADINGLVAVDFMKTARIDVPEELANLRAWFERVSSRPSAKA